MQTLEGRRFLITQSSLRLLAGSEINTLELAEYLQQQGAEVVVYTYFFSDPIVPFFKDRHIRVTTDEEGLRLEDFDYIWVHHQVLPLPFIKQLAGERPTDMPAFIFLHMSGLETHFLEQAHIWDMERRIASNVLFVSDEAKENIDKHSLDLSSLPTGMYRNPAPLKFSEVPHVPSKKAKSVLIVTNHPAEEVLEAKEILSRQGYSVVSAGEHQDEYRLIEPEYLRQFDVVVTIGKTVQYSLLANVPVYVYDVWGGPGYLNKANEATAASHNYSGRGFDKKDAATIAAEIINGREKAVQYQAKNHRRFVRELSIGTVLPEIIKNTVPRQIKPFDARYAQYLIATLTMLKYKFYHENLLVQDKETIIALEQSNAEKERVITERDQAIQDIRGSVSFRVGYAMVSPFRQLKQALRSLAYISRNFLLELSSRMLRQQ